MIDENGTPSDFSDDKFIYTPAADFFGTATFTYDMIDDAVGSVFSKGTVVVQVTEVNDVPVAVNKTVLGVEGTPSTYTGASIVSGLSKGPNEDSQTLSVVSAVAVSTTGGTVSVQNGDVLYTPSANFTGDFLFRYTVQDNGTNEGCDRPKDFICNHYHSSSSIQRSTYFRCRLGIDTQRRWHSQCRRNHSRCE